MIVGGPLQEPDSVHEVLSGHVELHNSLFNFLLAIDQRVGHARILLFDEKRYKLLLLLCPDMFVHRINSILQSLVVSAPSTFQVKRSFAALHEFFNDCKLRA